MAAVCRGQLVDIGSGVTTGVEPDLQGMDGFRAGVGLDQYPHYFGNFVFWDIHAIGIHHAPFGKRSPGAETGKFLGVLPGKNRFAVQRENEEAVLMLELLKDLGAFMKVRKKFWLAPIIIVMLLMGALIVLTQGSAVAPFIYTLF